MACCVWATLLKPDVARSGKENSPVPCTAWADQKWSTIPRSYLGWSQNGVGSRLALFGEGKQFNPFVSKEITQVLDAPIKFRTPTNSTAFGYPATLLVELCEALLSARDKGILRTQQAHIAKRAELLMRGFARVGIVALVDEATGYQRIRERNALAKILEAFVGL